VSRGGRRCAGALGGKMQWQVSNLHWQIATAQCCEHAREDEQVLVPCQRDRPCAARGRGQEEQAAGPAQQRQPDAGGAQRGGKDPAEPAAPAGGGEAGVSVVRQERCSTQGHARKDTRAHARARKGTHAWTRKGTHACTRASMHACTRNAARTCTHTQGSRRMHARMCARMQAHTCMQARTRIPTHVVRLFQHACTHTRMPKEQPSPFRQHAHKSRPKPRGAAHDTATPPLHPARTQIYTLESLYFENANPFGNAIKGACPLRAWLSQLCCSSELLQRRTAAQGVWLRLPARSQHTQYRLHAHTHAPCMQDMRTCSRPRGPSARSSGRRTASSLPAASAGSQGRRRTGDEGGVR